MTHVRRLRRRTAHSAATHERARTLAAVRLSEPLEPIQAAWLTKHLGRCESCRSVAAAYSADQAALRVLRDRQPVPPRDLWARTAAAIELESRSRPRQTPRERPSRRWSIPTLGLLSGLAVFAVVIGATVLSRGPFTGPSTAVVPNDTPGPIALASTAGTAGPTPIAVGAGSVGWIGTEADGKLAYNVTDVEEVCPAERQPDCAAVADRDSQHVDIAIRPKSISRSPVKNQAVVVGTDAAGSDAVLVIVLPTTEPSPGTTPSLAPTPPPTPVVTPTPATTPTPSSTPPVTPSPVVTASPAVTPTPTATATATAVIASPTPTATLLATATPSAVITATPTTSVAPTPTPLATPVVTPQVTPVPTSGAPVAIASNVKIVGESAAYSPDGAWFAFSARPSDDTAGPDIYVWRVGDQLARPVTTDHASVFASWSGGRILGSRPAAATASGETLPQSFFVDPASGAETPIAEPAWRPIVDPTNRWAVTWQGTVSLGPDGLTPGPATGSLVLRGFTPEVGLAAPTRDATVAGEGSISEFDVRWDETGTWLAVWLAEGSDPSIGRLSLLQLDPTTGTLQRPKGAPHDETAVRGFSITDGRLAWATPPGQGGEGSRVQIVAWTDQTVGAVESGPVEDVVVVH